MNFKFPQFTAMSIETIVPNASPECGILLSHLLYWNPSKRPTTSSALRYPYFSKCQMSQQSQPQKVKPLPQQQQPKQSEHMNGSALSRPTFQRPSLLPMNQNHRRRSDENCDEPDEDERSQDGDHDWKRRQNQSEARRLMGLKGSATYTDLSAFKDPAKKKNDLLLTSSPPTSPSDRDRDRDRSQDNDLLFSSKFTANKPPNSRASGNSIEKNRASDAGVKDQYQRDSRFPGQTPSRSSRKNYCSSLVSFFVSQVCLTSEWLNKCLLSFVLFSRKWSCS